MLAQAANLSTTIAFFLLLPLALGMLIGARWNDRREAIARVFIRISLAIIVLIIVGSGAADRIDPGAHGPGVARPAEGPADLRARPNGGAHGRATRVHLLDASVELELHELPGRRLRLGWGRCG